MDNQQEFQLRRKAMSLGLRGIAPQVILAKVHRSRAWLSKWQKRFDQQGVSGLHSRSRRPRHTPTLYAARVVQWIVKTRRRLVKQKVGLIGARAIRRELRKLGLGEHLPSLSTIKRVLPRYGLIARPSQASRAYFPKPLTVILASLARCTLWIGRVAISKAVPKSMLFTP
jgi:hypothetical protein